MRFLWILIPLAVIALAGFAEWLKFKRHNESIGESTIELSSSIKALEEEIEELRDERRRLIQRIQNLETIVTSEAWDTIKSDPELTKAKMAGLPSKEEEDDEKAERIAKRLRG